ncbi:hypothetical protein [Oryzifoliimicrobium ureilyticus]|uniref:hypothetical protein n=1 Tax=Oryzifoliimicrobium ureilyticus TaxID=3113724 RepID=UPI0030765C3C
MKKMFLFCMALTTLGGSIMSTAMPAAAQEYDWRRPGYDRGPPPRYYDGPRRHHHDNDGRAIAGGLAAGVIGGLIGGAIINNNSGPRYIDPPPPPPPRCWFEDRRVPNAYDGGWHMESMRVCN